MAAPPVERKLASKDDLSDSQKRCLKKVTERFESADKFQKPLREKWNVYYGLSRNYKRLVGAHAQATTPNDRDTVMREFQRVMGEELFIPYTFTVIETTVPKIFANDPRIICKPNDDDPATAAACDSVKELYERDQKAMRYPIALQETGRSGLRYGLGVQKSYWQRKYRSGKEVVPYESEGGYKVEDNNSIKVYEGPMVESVDIFDFLWDPDGHDLDSCDFVIHRTWRKMGYIKERVVEGRERRERGDNGGWSDLDLEAIEKLGSSTARSELWADRMKAAGMDDYEVEGNSLHEVWEYHDRDKVVTVLNRELVVQEAPNPFLHGDFPFQIWRPTIMEHEFCGVGVAEPIAHLQYELNTMRGQRRDAATMALNRPYFYQRGMVNPNKVVMGPNVWVPTTMDPRDVVFPAPIADLPASSVSEEEALKRDIEMTTGISESSTGGGGESTATGTQLVQAATNQRVRQMVKNLQHDLLIPEVAQRRALYQQNLTDEEQTQTIRVEDNRTPSGYAFIECGPDQLNANIDVEPVDGSTEAENEVQKRSDATQLMTALAPFMEELDTAKVLEHILRANGVDKPESFLKAPGPEPEQIVSAIGRVLLEANILGEEEISAVMGAALQQLEEEPQPEQTEGPSSNGAAPEPAGVA